MTLRASSIRFIKWYLLPYTYGIKMNLKYKILKTLVENKSKHFTIKQMSELLKVDYKNAYTVIQQITDSINVDKRSNASYISFKPEFTKDLFLVELERKAEVIKKIPLIYKDIISIENPLFIPVLFGSFAKGTNTKSSDIDICIIHDNEKEANKILRTLSIHPKIELQVFSYDEFIKMIKTKEFNVGHEIMEFGIPLINIESYYGVIRHG